MKITNSIPLICPQIVFKDRFGYPNAFVEMNPAIWFDEATQEWTVLVRGVNYRKYSNSSFTLYHSPAHSLYWIAKGKELNSLEFRELKFEYGSSIRYASYWNGVEDIRFIDKDTVIACVPQLNPNGEPALFKAYINRERCVLESFETLQPNESPEKNWLPFQGGPSGKDNIVLYKSSPLTLKPLETDFKQEISCPLNIQEALKGYHGSTNGVKIDDNWLFLVHKNNVSFAEGENRTVHRWLWISQDYSNIHISDPFTFFKHSYIEFPCGLVYKDKSLYVSLGVNDDKAYILEIMTPTTS